MATRKVTIEVEVPEDVEADFIETLRKKAWELYLTYKWLQLPEATPETIQKLAREAKKKAAEKIK